MAKDRLYVSPDYKSAIDGLKEKDVLGIQIAENKEIFMLAVALGIANPSPLKKRDGLSLYTALKTADKALIASVLLGTAKDNNDIDSLADFDASAELCEQCAETGYTELQKKYNDAGCDEELLERRMLKELEMRYNKIVADDI